MTDLDANALEGWEPAAETPLRVAVAWAIAVEADLRATIPPLPPTTRKEA